MITIIAKLKVKEGKMEEATAIIKKIAPKIKEAEPGCIAYIPHTVRGEDNTLLMYEKYNDKEALKLHSGNLATSLAELFPLLEPGMDIKTCYEIV
ncbi:MAG: antibiotic biosynthesis monooxygenase [Spirochaetes bacterium]|nr:antibiotic biosynthesis monooxygenase [Spirochaetota bacterium]